MDFEVKKAEDCFSNAENYEYLLPLNGEEFAALLAPQVTELARHKQLRRPTFTATLTDGTRVKGLLERRVIKVGYPLEPPGAAAPAQANFEKWLTQQ